MFCRNCGKELTGSPEFCLDCGARPLAGNSFCHGCGALTSPLAEFCAKCGVKLAKAEEVVKKRSGKLTAGGILSIISGAIAVVILGIVVAGAGEWIGGTAEPGISPRRIILIIFVVFGIVAIMGGIYALGRKSWGLSLAGGICASLLLFCPEWYVQLSFARGGICALLSPLFGISALVSIALSKDEFK